GPAMPSEAPTRRRRKVSVATKPQQRARRHRRIRAKIRGSAGRPRIAVYRSNRGISAQLIDDDRGHTLAAATWTESDLKGLPRMEQDRKSVVEGKGRGAWG